MCEIGGTILFSQSLSGTVKIFEFQKILHNRLHLLHHDGTHPTKMLKQTSLHDAIVEDDYSNIHVAAPLAGYLLVC